MTNFVDIIAYISERKIIVTTCILFFFLKARRFGTEFSIEYKSPGYLGIKTIQSL